MCIGVWIAALVPCLVVAATVERGVDYKGWDCVVMRNDNTEVVIAPDIAGRIIQYRVDGHDFLWVNEKLAGKVFPPEENSNMDMWKNYGGDKIWPAPQGWSSKDTWPGPGDPVIVAPHSCEIIKKRGKEVKVRITGSDKGGYAGVQFIRTLTLREGSSRLDHHIIMKNVSRRTVSWGIWTVTQMDFSDQGKQKGDHDWNEQACLLIPMNPRSMWPEKYQVMFGLASSFNWQPDYADNLMKVKYMNFVGKIVMDVSDGWAAMVDPASGYVFVQTFPYHPDAVYPDKGNYEVWVAGKGEFVHANQRRRAEDDPSARFVEMEILGPKTTLKPGEQTELELSWEGKKGGPQDLPGRK